MSPPATQTGSSWIAIVGNPNSGKSTLFNRLTGVRQKIGNYPGVTVEKKLGAMRLGEREVTVVDVPGAYSLAAASQDEQIVADILAGRVGDVRAPDLIVCVVDAVNLRRNLFFCSQLSDMGVPIVVALNMIDLAEKQGLKIDASVLSERMGVPVIPAAASSGRGVDEIRAALERGLREPAHFASVPWPAPVESAVDDVRSAVRTAVGRELPGWETRRLLFDVDSAIPERIGWKEAGPVLSAVRESLRGAGFDPLSVEAILRYAHIESILKDAVVRPERRGPEQGYAIDRVLTHRLFGLLFFFVLMLVVFSSIYWFASPMMDLIDAAFGAFGAWIGAGLASAPVLQSLVVDGVIAGVGGVVIFLPQILILFFFIALLEDSGYMARAAFLMDKVFSWTGLNGKSFVPMLSSYACAVPAIMGARTIENPRARITTILVSPLMSCSARLPVYVLLIGAFIQPHFGPIWAGVALFAMHLIGLVVAIPVAFLVNRFLLKLRALPFLMELPPYRRPRLRDVLVRMLRSGREFIVRAGTVILAFAVVIWVLTYFPRSDSVREELARAVAQERGIPLAEAEARLGEDLAPRLKGAYLESSYLGRFGKTIQPVFAPAGFDWKITVGVLASFPAREMIVSTLGIVYAVGEEDEQALKGKMASARWSDGRPVFTPFVAVAIMVFFALCLQCSSTIVIIGREAGWKWSLFAFTYMTALAWTGAVAVYQLGPLLWRGQV